MTLSPTLSPVLSPPRSLQSREPGGPSRFVTTLGACLHLVVPALVVVVALVCHLVHNPIPLCPLITLLSGAYGKAVLHDLLQSAVLRGGLSGRVSDDARAPAARPADVEGTR